MKKIRLFLGLFVILAFIFLLFSFVSSNVLLEDNWEVWKIEKNTIVYKNSLTGDYRRTLGQGLTFIDDKTNINFPNYVPFNETFFNLINSTDINFDYELNQYYEPGWEVYFKSNPTQGQVVKYRVNNTEITFQPMALNYRNNLNQLQQIQMIDSVIGVNETNKFTYPNAYGNGINLSYENKLGIMKENLIINSFSKLPPPQQYIIDGGNPTLDLDFIITTNSKMIINDGEWDKKTNKLVDYVKIADENGEILYNLPTPIIFDSNNNSIMGKYHLKKSGTSLYIILKTPYSFLENAVYPIYIDPTITLLDANTENLDDVLLVGTFGANENYDYSNYSEYDYLEVVSKGYSAQYSSSFNSGEDIINGSGFLIERLSSKTRPITGIKLNVYDCLGATTLTPIIFNGTIGGGATINEKVYTHNSFPCTTGWVGNTTMFFLPREELYGEYYYVGLEGDSNFTINYSSTTGYFYYGINRTGNYEVLYNEGRLNSREYFNYTNERSALTFNLSSIPEGVNIDDAKLYMYMFYGVGVSYGANISIHQINVSWDEETVTWNDVVFNETNESTVVARISTGWENWTITSLIRGQYENSFNNVSLLLKIDEENSSSLVRHFMYSKEYPVVTFRPYLEITYTKYLDGLFIDYPLNDTWINTNQSVNLNFTIINNSELDTCLFTLDNFKTNNTIDNCTNTTFNVSQGDSILTIWINETNGYFIQNSTNFSIDSIKPLVSNISITTTLNSQTISFDFNSTDTNLEDCWYSVFDSLGNIDSTTTENTSISCNTAENLETVSSFGTYNLTIYSNDSAGNENSTTEYFTTTQSISGGGGGGGEASFVTVIAIIKPTNFTKLIDSLQRAIIYARIDEYCINYSMILNCRLSLDVKNELLLELDRQRISLTKEEFNMFLDNYNKEELEEVRVTTIDSTKYNLVEKTLEILEQPFKVGNLDKFWIVGNKPFEYVVRANKPIESCEIIGGELGFSCESKGGVAIIRLELQTDEPGFTSKTFPVSVSFLSDTGEVVFLDGIIRAFTPRFIVYSVIGIIIAMGIFFILKKKINLKSLLTKLK